MAADIERVTGRAMSCDVVVLTVGGPAAAARRALRRIDELERRWSRFRPDSEISRLNAAGGRTMQVSGDTCRLVTSLVEAWHATDGAFDPTLLAPLVSLGYATSRDDDQRRSAIPPGSATRGRPEAIRVDATAGRRGESRSDGAVELPRGTLLDPGGLGKGLAADIVVEELLAAGARGVLVSIGGDLRVAGEPPDDDAWTIAVEPVPGEPPTLIRLADGGVATSTTRLRTWQAGDTTHHHLLDPDTAAPTRGEVIGATVIAGSAGWAEALTKPAFVRGPEAGLAIADRFGAAALLATDHGERRATPSWERFAAATTATAPVGVGS